MRRTFIFLFLALALFATFTHREAFFTTPKFEEGDDAANALQIHRAKDFRELHGNYSRWGFHHPGPAFFYVYALGETVLHDVLGVSSSPGAAHNTTSTLLQLAFFSAALVLLARHSRQPLLFLGLAVALGGWHFGHVYRAVYSIWPPDVLLMPFLCFVIACASTAVGNRAAVPVLVLCGGFLVHGHVAQPLFVIPMASAALIAAGFVSRERLTGFVRSRNGAASLALLALFLLPLVVDLFAGKNSNAYDVWLHMKHQSDGGQSFAEALLCYASYFVGMNDPSMFNDISPASFTPFQEELPLLSGWLILLALAVAILFRKKPSGKSDDDVRLGRALLWFWLAAGALTVVWGMRQDGGFTSFNSHFNHSLVFIVALMALFAAVRLLPTASKPFGAFLIASAVPVFVLAVEFDWNPWSRGHEVEAHVSRLLRVDPNPTAPKFIRFTATASHTDWYEAVTLARAFERRGIEFYVGPDERVMFGREKVLEKSEPLAARGLSVWQLVPRQGAPDGALALNRVCSVVFPQAPSARIPFHLEARSPRLAPLVLLGLESAEEEWAWTTGRLTVFRMETPAARTDLELALDTSGLTATKTNAGQRVRIVVNGQEVGRATFTDNRRVLRIRIPRDTWNALSPRHIALELPDAIPPAHFAPSGDRRLLGLRFHALSLAETP